jgi:predicted Ser/Thr protein kinase
LPVSAARLQNADAVIVCAECGSDNEALAEQCRVCGTVLDNAAARALLGQQVLGTYQLLDIVGKGGMSVVYKARHRITEQVVALKILPAELAVHSDIKARFIEEAKALARLEHPNIVRLYNFGEDRGRFVLAMQFVLGTTFERKIFAAGKLAWREAVDVARQVLAALDYAHAQGIVHRDIKPSNILVRDDGSAMVMDFGIAKMAEGSARLTATGQTMGTVRYMSPEQVRGQVVDHRSDLYSVGATLYEALVGETPFDGTTHFEIMMKHLNETAPSILGQGVAAPPALDQLVRRALAKDPADRYQKASDFLGDLDRVLETAGPAPTVPAAAPPEPVSAPTPSVGAAPRRRRPAAWMALAALVSVAAAVVLVATWSARRHGTSQKGDAGAEAWPTPQLVPGITPVVDQRFDAPELVRVIAPRAVDAAELARAYVAARGRFAAWAEARHGATAVIRPLNLVVAPPDVLCAAVARYTPSAAPADCATKPPRFLHVPRSDTLYVLDDERLETVNLPEGASQHLCTNTPALLEKRCMRSLLPPYWDEIERAPSP